MWQGYFPTEYNIDCFKAYRRELDALLGEFKIELDKLNDLYLVNCDKDLKEKRRHLVRRIQVPSNRISHIYKFYNSCFKFNLSCHKVGLHLP